VAKSEGYQLQIRMGLPGLPMDVRRIKEVSILSHSNGAIARVLEENHLRMVFQVCSSDEESKTTGRTNRR
jgi:hypothetical protein